jgi:hypothetical protein
VYSFYKICAVVSINDKCDHPGLNGVTIWDETRMQKSERAFVSHYLYSSFLVQIHATFFQCSKRVTHFTLAQGNKALLILYCRSPKFNSLKLMTSPFLTPVLELLFRHFKFSTEDKYVLLFALLHIFCTVMVTCYWICFHIWTVPDILVHICTLIK